MGLASSKRSAASDRFTLRIEKDRATTVDFDSNGFVDDQDLERVLRSFVLDCPERALRLWQSNRSSGIIGGGMGDYFKHESAYVDEGAAIGSGTKIWHFSHISSPCTIGQNCSLGQNVFVAKHVTIGNGVKIQNNVSVYEGVVLEDHVFCGPSMVFTNVKTPRSAFPRNTAEDYLETRVCYGASIGANATIVCGVRVGQWAFIGAGSVVTKDVPDYALIVGVPGRQVGWACECGLALKFSAERCHCDECGREYMRTGEFTIRRIE